MPIPLRIVTGLLGSGKTCVMQHLLADPRGIERPGVVVGEFAEEGFDAELIKGAGVPIRQLSSVGVGDQRRSYADPVRDLVQNSDRNCIFLETSGVVEIRQVVDDLHSDKELLRSLVWGPTVTVIDAGAFELHSKRFGAQFWAQVEAADVVVINKTDRVSAQQLEVIKAGLRERNDTAVIEKSYMGQVRRVPILDVSLVDFTPRILSLSASDRQVTEFEAFVYKTEKMCYHRVKFGHLLLNLPGVHIARFKGRLKVWDKTYCVNGFPGQLDWDNTPVTGSTSLVFIGLGLHAEKERIIGLLEDELDEQRRGG